jgi:hypothetical protein
MLALPLPSKRVALILAAVDVVEEEAAVVVAVAAAAAAASTSAWHTGLSPYPTVNAVTNAQ